MYYRKKKHNNNSRIWINTTIGVLCGVIVILFFVVLLTQTGKPPVVKIQDAGLQQTESTVTTTTTETTAPSSPLLIYPTEAVDLTSLTDANIVSKHALLLDLENNEILAERGNINERIYPASMTKLMTLVVAVEQIDDMNDTFTMTYDIIAPLIEAEASRAGFSEGEVVTIQDLLYGIALPSGADATTAIAQYISGSEEAFVDLMNEKALELGLENTHFSNASGLHDENHYSTVTDIAMLMEYVMQNDTCREILSTYQYTTSQTEQHPEGILLENTMFSRMYGNEVNGMTIEAGKTGYTDEAGHCLVSYATSDSGKNYIVVTAGGNTYWNPVFDTFAMYGIVSNGYPMPTDLTTAPMESNVDTITESNLTE